MERISGLNNYQKGILIVMAAMSLIFAMIYLTTIERVGYEYNDTIIASRDLQGKNAYEAVTQGTENATYKTQSEIKTLGNLAKDYYNA